MWRWRIALLETAEGINVRPKKYDRATVFLWTDRKPSARLMAGAIADALSYATHVGNIEYKVEYVRRCDQPATAYPVQSFPAKLTMRRWRIELLETCCGVNPKPTKYDKVTALLYKEGKPQACVAAEKISRALSHGEGVGRIEYLVKKVGRCR